MSPFVFALIASASITVCLLVLKSKDNQEPNSNYGLKVLPISFIAVFICYSYLIGGEGSIAQDIDIGEPPF